MESRKLNKNGSPAVGFKNAQSTQSRSSIIQESRERMKALEEENELSDDVETPYS